MPKQVLFSMIVEAGMILLTTFMLTQPALVFGKRSESVRSMARAGGLFLLCLTFCWSVVLGCTLTINALTIRI